MKTKPKHFGFTTYVYLIDDNFPDESDMSFTQILFDYELEMHDNDFNSNFHKLEYVFAIRKDNFGPEIIKKKHTLWKHKGEIRLKDHDFFLIKRDFIL